MKRDELLKNLKAARGYGYRALIPYLLILATFAAVTWWYALSNEARANPRISGFMLLGFIALVYGGLIPTAILRRRFQRRLGLECPGCRKLLEGFHAQIVVASRRCGRCGVVVVHD